MKDKTTEVANLIEALYRAGWSWREIAENVMRKLGQEPVRGVEAERIAAMENK